MCQKVDSLLPRLDSAQQTHVDPFVKLEAALLGRALYHDLPHLRDQILEHLLPLLSKNMRLFGYFYDKEVLKLFQNDDMLAKAGVSRAIVLCNSQSLDTLSASKVLDLLQGEQQNPFDFGRCGGKSLFKRVLKRWKIHGRSSAWEDCVAKMLTFAQTEDHCLDIAKAISYGALDSAYDKPTTSPSITALCLQAVSQCPAACNIILEPLFLYKSVEEFWRPLKAALLYRNSIHDDLLIDRKCNAAIAELVWRMFMKSISSIEICAWHVKYALDCFYEVPAFVERFLARAAGLCFTTALSHAALREVIATKVDEFHSNRHKLMQRRD
jgi:hypothetical protein